MSTSSSNLELNLDADGVLGAVPAWKQELNERLQATRARHSRRVAEPTSLPNLEHISKSESRAARLAAKVAERYANAPSYSDILAAATAARQVCATAQALLEGLEFAAGEPAPVAAPHASTETQGVRRGDFVVMPTPDVSPLPRQDGNQDNHSQDAPLDRALHSTWGSQEHREALSAEDLLEEATVSPAQPLPVNLIEFPRELVAARKARPRLAEGPLRESLDDAATGHSQLRIFEVETESISKTVKIDAQAPEWSPIRLDAKPSSIPLHEERTSSLQAQLKPAPLEDRLMAGMLDAVLVLFAFVLFILIFAASTTHIPSGKPALLAAGLALLGLSLSYQYLFFRFTEGTPGMRYAKIALCTFEDENPTRKAMRRRILFLLFSAAPLGLGFAWAWCDPDRLGWHDRLTRMYQRSYR